MPENISDLLNAAVILAVFGLVLALWLLGVFLWYGRKMSFLNYVRQRLASGRHTAGDSRELRLWKDGEERTLRVPDQQQGTWRARLTRLHKEAGWRVPMQTVFLGALGTVLMVFVVAFMITENLLGSLCCALAVLLGFWTYTKGRVGRRLGVLESQFVEALELAARSLRAGHPLPAAFRLIADELPAPICTLFAEINQLQGLGLSSENAIKMVAQESGSSDINLFATSVVIQMRTGGNLADMMTRLAHIIRDRMRLKRRVRVLTAQTQLSKRVLSLLPFVLLGALSVINGDYMDPLFSSRIGHYLLAVAGLFVLGGVWMMNRLSQLHY